jgi:hypothetical protein
MTKASANLTLCDMKSALLFYHSEEIRLRNECHEHIPEQESDPKLLAFQHVRTLLNVTTDEREDKHLRNDEKEHVHDSRRPRRLTVRATLSGREHSVSCHWRSLSRTLPHIQGRPPVVTEG